MTYEDTTTLITKWVAMTGNETQSIIGLKTMLAQILASENVEVTKEVIIDYLNDNIDKLTEKL